MFANQAQELQPIRLARIGGKHLRQNLFGLPPLTVLNEVYGPQNRRGHEMLWLHGDSIKQPYAPSLPANN